MERDARTTPPLLRWVGLVFLAALAGYFALCANATLRGYATPFGRDHYWSAWMGSWWMFTYRTKQNTALDMEAQRGEAWEAIDAEALFPTRWESGLRFDRPFFRQIPYLTALLAQSTCHRLEAHGTPATAVRLIEVHWAKTLGSVEQPRDHDLSTKTLLTFSCSDSVPGPTGIPL